MAVYFNVMSRSSVSSKGFSPNAAVVNARSGVVSVSTLGFNTFRPNSSVFLGISTMPCKLGYQIE